MPEGIHTVHIEPEKEKQLTMLAKHLKVPTNQLVSQAIDDFLEVQTWQIEQTKLAIQEADAGDFATEQELDEIENRYKPQ